MGKWLDTNGKLFTLLYNWTIMIFSDETRVVM